MDDFLVGLFALGLGLAVCFLGLRLFFFMLPIWGFVAGFFVGAAGVTAIFGDGFLSTVTGWVIGFFVGLLFAVASYFVWYIGAIIAAGSVGALLGSGLMAAFNVDSEWVIFIVAVIGAALFALAALVLALPVWIVLVNTAIAGAMAAVAGAMLIFDRIDLDDLQNGSAWALIEESWFWVLVWIVVAVLGIVSQMRQVTDVVLPEEKWVRADPNSPSVSATPSY